MPAFDLEKSEIRARQRLGDSSLWAGRKPRSDRGVSRLDPRALDCVHRALTFFDDAEREAPLPGEGKNDWKTVREFFLTRVGGLLVPPTRKLEIQKRAVGVR